MAAAMVRASLKTFEGYDQMAERLCELGFWVRKCSECALRSTKPPGWDSESFCWALSNASKGRLEGLSLAQCEAVREVINDFHSRPNTTGIQSKVYKAIVKASGSLWQDLINRRLQVLSPTEVPNEFTSSQSHFCKAAKQVGPGIMMTVIKTILNSWVTSHKFHEAMLIDCIFGCEGCKDTLTHYLSCDPFWTLLVCTCKLDGQWLGMTPAKRLGIRSPNKTALTLITVASRCYHAIRMSHANILERASRARQYEEVHDLLFERAGIFFRDLF